MALCTDVCVVRLPPKIWYHALSQSKFDISGHANWITQLVIFVQKMQKKKNSSDDNSTRQGEEQTTQFLCSQKD